MKPNASWDYRISAKALKQLRKLDKQSAARILNYLDERIVGSDDPRQWGKQLRGELNNIWRYRSGEYRILCQLQEEVYVVLVLEVGHRQDIYRIP